nr:hypothetical protein [uncultured bacterium]
MTDYPGLLTTEIGPGAWASYNNITPPKDYQISPEEGYAVSLGYNYFLPNVGNTSYQVISGLGQTYLSGGFLPDRNVIKLRAAASVSPPQNSVLYGYQQAGGEYGFFLVNQLFIQRGYPFGEFIGHTLINANFEYRFPLGYPFAGSGTFPVFTEAWHMALVADALTLDGGYYDSSTTPSPLRVTKLGTVYVGTGAELKGNFQILYGWDVMFKFGVYYGLTANAYGGPNIQFGFWKRVVNADFPK